MVRNTKINYTSGAIHEADDRPTRVRIRLAMRGQVEPEIFDLNIDVNLLAQLLAPKAIRSAGGRAQLGSGAIKMKHVSRAETVL